MSRWIRTEREVVRLSRVTQRIQYDAGLHARKFATMIELKDLVTILGKVQDHCEVAALPTQAGPTAT